MTQRTIAGPGRVIHGSGGGEVPFYIVPFDKRGACTGPTTRDRLVEAAQDATDIFVFSHGWNNDWAAATKRYDDFIREFLQLRTQQWSAPDRPYKPILAGVFWPSTALVAPWEGAPDIAGGGGLEDGEPAADVVDLAVGLPPDQANTLYELADRERLSYDEGLTLAQLICSQLNSDDEIADDRAPDARGPNDLMEAWSAVSGAGGPNRTDDSSPTGHMLDDDPDESLDDGTVDDAHPTVSGLGVDNLDPRWLVRLATVLLMKDRAGTVGSNGVADLLLRLNGAAPRDEEPGRAVAPARRIHLIGHSYGAKVMLSALRAPEDGRLTVDSVLLLQPAISAYCFAAAGSVPGSAQAGGYQSTLLRSRQPILCTFSRHDGALHDAFHWAARRRGDLGEVTVAADGPPSRYAALGGYGPQGTPFTIVDAVEPPTPYRFPPGETGRVIGVRADDVIRNHGNVASQATAWMLLNQVRS